LPHLELDSIDRSKEIRRVEHVLTGRLERGARARGSGEGRSGAEA
jgi:hypothetical protein